ncbi:NuoI/complex I 23 kDa subunit family protein [Sphaerisporangium album]|uniref:NuoI/complex I 23 kDa subunit family protein n=1 Tax=Sphaerisporangium album TaxID=509200 RepID=UPI002482BE7B|nr:NADH-quinone oxidoreductase subunit I [Sphaerisporangium album]
MAKGLAVTLRHMLSKSETRQYPEERPDLPPRSRGVIALVEENCTVCMLCARECPDWCIYIDSHKETTPAPEGGRPRAHNVLDRFAIDFSLCMYCGICIEVCPFDALFWSPEFEYAEYDIRNLLHEKDKLGEWVQTIPIPPPHDPNAEPPKELAAATRPPRAGGPAPSAPAAPAPSAPAGPAPSAPAAPAPSASAGSGLAAQPPAGPAPGGAAAGGSAPAGPAPEGSASGGPESGGAETGGPSTTARTAPGSRGATSESAARAAVRAIRPPGALPKKPAPTQPAPAESEGESPTGREVGPPSRGEEEPPKPDGPAGRS